jgi:hypothetical protein
MLLDRRRRSCDVAACALILLALCSTSLSIAFLIGIAVEIAWTRRRWQDAWIVAIPLVLYLIWASHYQPNQVDLSAIPDIPLNFAKACAAALSNLTGLSGVSTFDQTGTSLTYGVPLLVLASLLLVSRALSGKVRARTMTLLITLAVFTASVTVAHDGIASMLSSRYVYVYCLLTTLLIAELARGVRISRPVQCALCLVTALAIVSNVGSLRTFGNYLRQSGEQTDGALGALALDRASVAPDTLARVALYPFIKLSARSYFAAADALGTPAFTAAQLPHADSSAQSAADTQLIADQTVVLRGVASAPSPAARPPTVDVATDGMASRTGGCVDFVPSAAIPPGATGTVAVTVAAGSNAVSVRGSGAPTTVSVSRFAPAFSPLGTVVTGGTAVVLVRHDAATEPWHLQVQSPSSVRICALPHS